MATVERQRLNVPAREVRPGDWTEFNGHRLVYETRTLRRGRVGFVRAGGRMTSEDKLPADLEIVVYRNA